MRKRVVQLKRGIPGRIAMVRGERSQRQFAKDIGTFQQNMNRYERGESVPHVDILIRLAQKERVSIDWLLTGKGQMRRAA